MASRTPRATGVKTLGTTTNRSPLVYRKPTVNTSLTWVRANHTYKAGGEARFDSNGSTLFASTNGSTFQRERSRTSVPAIVQPWGRHRRVSVCELPSGEVDQVRIAPVENMRIGKHLIGLFAQDTWKVTRKLTLDYGIRYDYQTYLKESTDAPSRNSRRTWQIRP